MRGSSRHRIVVLVVVLAVLGFLSTSGLAQTVVFSDNFDDGDPGGVVSGTNWSVLPGKVNGYPLNQLIGSYADSYKNHTPSTDGQMGDPSIGGAAFEVDNNPAAYASYHEFDAQSGILRLSIWVWEDAERPLCTVSTRPVRGMVGLTSLPGSPTITTGPCGGEDELYPYDDYAFIGVESAKSNDPADPIQKFYRWRTKMDGWNLTSVPRKADYVCHGAQTWRHVEIVVHPYTGQVGDIQFFIDGALVGEGRRQDDGGCHGIDFVRIELGTRFPEQADALACRPTYSYEHFWFDDVVLTVEPAGLPCSNPDLRFDADNDGDVDQVDFAAFQLCYTGADDAGGLYDCLACRCMNSNADADIDADDLGAFEECASGPGIAANVACDNSLPNP